LFAVVALSFFPRETSAHKKFTFTTTHANELEEGFFQGGVESQIKHIFEIVPVDTHGLEVEEDTRRGR
jgi:hypothetical protein